MSCVKQAMIFQMATDGINKGNNPNKKPSTEASLVGGSSIYM